MRCWILAKSVRARAAAIALSFAVIFVFSAWTFETPTPVQPSLEALRAHSRYLASEELTGRAVDTPGIKLARDYIAREFARYGLRPGGEQGSYLQRFDVATGVAVKQPTGMSLGEQAPSRLNDDWIPLGLSSSGQVTAELVFAGYGITAKDYGYDDYAGIDVKDKIVLVLRYEPPPKDEKSPFQKLPRYSNHATLRAKAVNARDHGALGMILVDLNHSGDERKELIPTRSTLWRSGRSVIAAQVKRGLVEKWLDARGVSLKSLKETIDREEKPASRHLPGAQVALQVTLEETREPTENVVGILPGTDSRMKDEHIVIGAHYDHVGFGHFGSRNSSAEGQIHYGADDNASGTAVLLQLAEQLSRSQPRPARTIVFAAFSAEELGLHGSRHYVNHPPMPLPSAKAMLNLDMVGRLRDCRLTVFGTRSAKELSEIVKNAAFEHALEINESDGVGRSDHMSFYNNKIPVLHFFTGSHPDYHGPGDTWDKLNIEGMAKISDLVAATVRHIANTTEPLSFVSLPSRAPGSRDQEPTGYGTYLGSIPDFGGSEDGVRLAGVSDGSPAALAGLREGDVIVKFGGARIQTLEDLTEQLRNKKPGDEVEIVIRRGKQSLPLKAVLRARG
jgi:aminopeptidase YwaD